MKISVIVPVYNVKDYLRECIESVIKQTYRNFELILVDDGSTDGSAVVCDQYSEVDFEHIKTLHVSNGGPLRARLIGVQEAIGDVLVFLDSDDCLHIDALSKIGNLFEANRCDMVLYNAGVSEEFYSRQIVHSLKDGQMFERVNKYELYKKIIQGEIPNSVCLKAIRKERAYFPEYFMDFTMRHGEDLLLSVNFITNCEKIVYMDEGLYYYRDRPGSAIHSFNFERKESIKIVHTELEKYINQWGMPELKPIHNARKVRGWMEQLILLIKNRKSMRNSEFRKQLCSMAEDPYFRSAYIAMDKTKLSNSFRRIAFLLYHCSFLLV